MIELRNITKRFGDVVANNGVSIKVAPGTIHAIVGENGAGKSTAMRIAYGFYTADSGEILINGQVCEIRTPHDAIAQGVGMVHQHFMLVEPMTVAENIVLGSEPGTAAALDLKKAAVEIRKLSDEFKLSVDPNAIIETLSVGQQQRVELLKALYRHAQLLILDEPTAVLTPQEVDEFFVILRRMREQGKTIVIITHKLSEVLAISDNVTVMRDGRVVGEVKTSETNAADLARLMVGREVLLRVEKPDAHAGKAVLSVRDLTIKGREGAASIDNVSFEVRAGEIVGIAGVEGNGQTELIEGLAGLQQPASGDILFENDPRAFWSYPAGKTLTSLLIILLLISLVSTGLAILTAASRQGLFLVPLVVALTGVFVRCTAIWGLIIALKKRSRWAPMVVGILASLAFLLTLGSFLFAGSPGILLAALNGSLLIYTAVLGFRTHREFRGQEKSELRKLLPRQIKELGVAHVPEDRHRRGLLLDFTLCENTILGVHYRKPAVMGFGSILLDQNGIQRRTDQVIRDFDVRPPNSALPVRALSGGNQQKLIIGREFELPPKLLLVSQPTRGVDIGAIEFIHRKLVALRDDGCAVLLVSAELEEVTALSDRLLVIHNGHIVGEVDPRKTTNEEIGLMMTGGSA